MVRRPVRGRLAGRAAPSPAQLDRAGLGGGGPGGRPGEGEQIARQAGGQPVVRYSSALPLEGTTGDIEALSLWAGQSVALARRSQPAAAIVAELTSLLGGT
ncbi:MAG TPA: hypothetical protein VGS06_40440 [Streptosporangiaceae bacterium]|nr:hypothetical protein [Streptosporangiaceae bacterium]